MPMRSPLPRDVEKSQSVRFGSVQYVDDPRASTDSEMAARPHILRPRRSWRSRIISPDVIPWFLTCVFATTTILLLLERPDTLQYGTYETAFSTDLKSLRKVPLEIRRFGGSPLFDSNGTMHTPPVDENAEWPENLDFTSQSKETDRNWRELLEDRFFSVSEEEAVEAWGEKRHQYIDEKNGGYTAGLDVFHSLHCLNEIRMALNQDKYTLHGMPVETSPAHTAHCLDVIRQHIQCYGSTTLIPTQYREDAHRAYIDSNQEHVCRDFSYLRHYMHRRSAEGDLYVSRDDSLTSAGTSALDQGVEIKVVESEVPA